MSKRWDRLVVDLFCQIHRFVKLYEGQYLMIAQHGRGRHASCVEGTLCDFDAYVRDLVSQVDRGFGGRGRGEGIYFTYCYTNTKRRNQQIRSCFSQDTSSSTIYRTCPTFGNILVQDEITLQIRLLHEAPQYFLA